MLTDSSRKGTLRTCDGNDEDDERIDMGVWSSISTQVNRDKQSAKVLKSLNRAKANDM